MAKRINSGMAHWKSLAVCLFVAGSSLTALCVVCDKDNRVPMNPGTWPYSAIGKVDGESSWGTGTLVGRRTVLTAAHVVVNSDTNQIDKRKFRWFLLGVKDGREQQKVAITDCVVGTLKSDSSSKEQSQDWALLTLKDPVGERFGFIGVQQVSYQSIPNELTGIGYSKDFMSGRTAGVDSTGVIKRRFDNSTIYMDMDLTEGASGGPLLAKITPEGEPRIVGIIIAQLDDQKPGPYSEDHCVLGIASDSFYKSLLTVLETDKEKHPPPLSEVAPPKPKDPAPSVDIKPLSKSELTNGESLQTGKALTSPSGEYSATCQNDGNLVLYRNSTHQVIWASQTQAANARLELEPGGSLVLRNETGHEVWRPPLEDTGNTDYSRSVLKLTDKGVLVLFSIQGSRKAIRWSSSSNPLP